MADLAAAHFVGVLMRLRARLAPLLLPPRFDSPRDIRWHSAVDPRVEPIWDAEALELAVAGGARDTNYIAFSGGRGFIECCSAGWDLLLGVVVRRATAGVARL